ncbi:dynein axonemal assembly factor 8 [Osmerus mordax]|uniref:dynein axonemal assembly factor 8 n=1 Tax=Osmerus mordax TaxID=8014 RepID=UPI00350ECAFD
MDLNHSHWNSLLESIRSGIPSIDSDTSSISESENGEDTAIFRRPTALLPQNTEDLEEFLSASWEDSDVLEEVSQYRTENTLCDQVEPTNETLGAREATNSTQEGTMQPTSNPGIEKPGFHIDYAIKSSQTDRLWSCYSTMEMKEHQDYTCLNKKHTTNAYITGPVTLETVGTLPTLGRKATNSDNCLENSKTDDGFPILSLMPLEQWDLDQVLQTLQKDEFFIQGSMSGDNTEGTLTHTSQESIMERLDDFCKKQLHEEIEVKEKTVMMKKVSVPQLNISQNPTDFSQKVGQRKSSQTMAAELQFSRQESPTVYIDLRCCPVSALKTTRTSNFSKPTIPILNNTKSPEEKALNNRLSGSISERRERTGKSMLLQRVREANRQIIESDRKRSAPVEDTGGSIGCESCCENVPRLKAPPNVLLPNVNSQSPAIQGDKNRPLIARAPTAQQTSTTKQPKPQNDQQRKEQLKQKLQHRQRHQLQKKIECHKPRRSVNDTEPAADKTDVLYDSEASYLQSVKTLPTDIIKNESLLLTVCLSSIGIVAGNSHGKAQTVESSTTKSHIYNTLVSWFLSLVGPGPRCKDKAGIEAPFWVAGLQQLWRENGLALHILAVSHEQNTLLCSKSKKRAVNKGRSAFHHRVCKFLSQTPLTVAANWLPQLSTLLEPQASLPVSHVPSACLSCFVSVSSDQEAVDSAFGLSPGFYWQTLENQDPSCQRVETMCTQQLHTEVVFALGYKTLILQPLATHHTLQLIFNSGLDVCGLRLLYPSTELLTNSAGCKPCGQDHDGTNQPVLALALRGPHARAVWQDVTGPADPSLARKTDPVSINALHGSCKDQPLFYSPHMASRVQRELCVWFAERAPTEASSTQDQAITLGDIDVEKATPSWCLTRTSANLCATVTADVFLIVSPVVAPCCYSQVLSVCERRGFSLKGLKRVQLSNKQAQALRLTRQQVSMFCRPPAVFLDEDHVELSSHCLVLLLRRENALRHCASLPAALVKGFEEQGVMGCTLSRLSDDIKVGPGRFFHILPYAESLLDSVGGSMWEVPEPCRVLLSSHCPPSSSDVEQVVVLTLSGTDMSQGLSILQRALRQNPTGNAEEGGFELLALKWLPTLSRQQAREVSPFEVGDQLWQSSLAGLASSPALVCVLRRVNAYATLRRLLPSDDPLSLNVLVSSTPELAYRQALLFFFEGEIIPDNSVRQLLKFLPPPCINAPGSKSVSLLSSMANGPQQLVTMCLFKPGAWSHVLGKILRKVQQNGFTVVGLRMVVLDTSTAKSLLHANKNPCDVEAQVQHLCSGPSLALSLQRENAVKRLLDLLGPEDQTQARAQDQFLWRAYYGTDNPHSGIYGSATYRKAVQDVKRMFPEGMCCTETETMRREQIPCVHSDSVACVIREQSYALASMAKEKASLTLLMESGKNGGSLVRSALCQTTCLLVPFNVLQVSRVPLQLDLLESLLKAGCHLVAGRMSVLDEAQRQHISKTLGGKTPHLPEGPCLVVALQRDNVVTCFDSLLERSYRERSDLEKVGKGIIYPCTEKEAEHLLCYLFDVLSPDSHHAIVPQ